MTEHSFPRPPAGQPKGEASAHTLGSSAPHPTPARVGRVPLWAIWSGGFAVAAMVLYVLAVLLPVGQRVDMHSLGAFTWMGASVVNASRFSRTLLPLLLAVACASVVLRSLLAHRWRATVLALVGAGVVTLGAGPLRYAVLPRPRYGDLGMAWNSYPSRHVVFVLAVSLVILRLWPTARVRSALGLDAIVVTVAIAFASVAGQGHRASDVLGAVLLVGVVAPLIRGSGAPGIRVVFREGRLWLWAAAAIVLGAVLLGVPWEPAYAVGGAIVVLLGTAVAALIVVRVAVPGTERFSLGGSVLEA
jgi:hypothetical protein